MKNSKSQSIRYSICFHPPRVFPLFDPIFILSDFQRYYHTAADPRILPPASGFLFFQFRLPLFDRTHRRIFCERFIHFHLISFFFLSLFFFSLVLAGLDQLSFVQLPPGGLLGFGWLDFFLIIIIPPSYSSSCCCWCCYCC